MNLATNLAPKIAATIMNLGDTMRNLVAHQPIQIGGGGAPPASRGNGGQPPGDGYIIWIVFAACLLCSGVGVAISFVLLAPRIGGAQMWSVGFVVAIVMLGISYGAKYANENARRTFTPVDLIQYLSQGFLWPSAWPALATFVGIKTTIAPPQTTAFLHTIETTLAALSQMTL
jgi:hypothetical protein